MYKLFLKQKTSKSENPIAFKKAKSNLRREKRNASDSLKQTKMRPKTNHRVIQV